MIRYEAIIKADGQTTYLLNDMGLPHFSSIEDLLIDLFITAEAYDEFEQITIREVGRGKYG